MGERIKALEHELREANTRRLIESANAMHREECMGFGIVAARVDAEIDSLRALAFDPRFTPAALMETSQRREEDDYED